MIRIEAKTPHKTFAQVEDTIEEAKAYIASLEDAGIEFVYVRYFDLETRIADIRAGKFSATQELS